MNVTCDFEEWSVLGCVNLEEFQLDRVRIGRLRIEAACSRAERVVLRGEQVENRRDGSLLSPARFGYAKGRSELLSLLRDEELLALIRRRSGLNGLVPVGCAYNHYDLGDFIGVHRDTIKATVTVTLALSEGLVPMGWAPELRKVSNLQVCEFIGEAGHLPVAGGTLEHSSEHLVAFDGYNVPHWRTAVLSTGTLATMSYYDL